MAIICNSSNIDFYKYFSALVEHLEGEHIHFLANKNIVKKLELSKRKITISSFVKNSFLDVYSIVDFSVALFLLIKLKFKKVKLIHFITAHSSNIPQAFFARLLGINVAFTIHDLEPHPDKKSFFISLYNKLIINFLGNYIFVHNKAYQHKIKKKTVEHIPLSGFEKEFVRREFQKKLLFFGRIEPYKGVENLFLLGEELLNSNLEYEIIITGKGDIPYGVEKVPKNVKIINRFISDEELRTLHESCSFSILPYNSASQSGVIIHSYSYGTPVIAYDVGALSEYIIHNETGLLVAHNDFKAIIEFLTNIDKQQYQYMQDAVMTEFEGKYDSKCFARYSGESYSKILRSI